MALAHLTHLPPTVYVLATLLGAGGVIAWRFRETRSPVTIRKLILPPLGMSTGFFMFVVPATRVPWTWAVSAFVVGAGVFAYPLARSSKLTCDGGRILMKRSKAFLLILLGLVAVRFAMREWIERYVSQLQTGALFFILAFGAILRWRLSMLRQYLRLRTAPQ